MYLAMANRASTAIITCTTADIGAMVAVMAARTGWLDPESLDCYAVLDQEHHVSPFV